MPIILPTDFVTMPWKNGGGITHEIAHVSEGGRLLWRLSMAEVATDGPFSAFPGLMRILTVIRGAGLVLRTPEGVIEAEPFRPVRFSGDLPVDCSRIAGEVTDLNVIFDPSRIAARVTRLRGPEDWQATGPAAFLCLAGVVEADGIRLPEGAAATDPGLIALAQNGSGLLVTLDRI